MPKPKQFVKETKKKSSKHAAQTPQTADEYLVAGVDFEEAGEKWRAGDAAKSTRFFVRAIDIYDEALKKFPLSFDLAYNKARVQYELTQHPRLAAQLPGTLLDLLKTALESSRAALNLRQDNADVLFNTAQVLTSLVEALTEDRSGSVSKEDGLRLLEEAIELFQRCLTLQEFHYAESQAQEEEAAINPTPSDTEIVDSEVPSSSFTSSHDTAPTPSLSGASSFSTSQSLEQEERWATIVEPVTNDTLLDTVLAQLETLTLLSELITTDQGRGLAWIEEYSTPLLNTKLAAYVPGTDRDEEAALTRAKFIAALANANFRCQRIDAPTYQRALDGVFANLDLAHDPEGLCDKAEALVAYSNALVINVHDASSRWTALTTALDALTAASKLPTAQNLAAIHLLRGDVELLRYQLGQAPLTFPAAVRSAGTLLKNAGTYYRGAEREAVANGNSDEEDVEERREALVKGALVQALGGESGRLEGLLNGEKGGKGDGEEKIDVQRILEEAVEGGLVGVEWLVREEIVGE